MTYVEMVLALKAMRQKSRVDTMTISQIIGVADSSVGQWESFKKIPNGSNLIAWANALDFDVTIVNSETICPANFDASDAVKEWTENQDIDYDREREKFIDYYTAKGRTANNWESMFKLWVRRSVEFRAESDRTRATFDKTSPTFVRERRKRILDMSNVSSKFLERKSKDK